MKEEKGLGPEIGGETVNMIPKGETGQETEMLCLIIKTKGTIMKGISGEITKTTNTVPKITSVEMILKRGSISERGSLRTKGLRKNSLRGREMRKRRLNTLLKKRSTSRSDQKRRQNGRLNSKNGKRTDPKSLMR
jgi:hypothetical protein